MPCFVSSPARRSASNTPKAKREDRSLSSCIGDSSPLDGQKAYTDADPPDPPASPRATVDHPILAATRSRGQIHLSYGDCLLFGGIHVPAKEDCASMDTKCASDHCGCVPL